MSKPTYPVRPMIFQPVIRFGVAIEDWPIVLILTFLVTLPFWFARTMVAGFPAWYLVAIGSFCGVSGFFAWARIGKPRRFAHHFFRYLVSPKQFDRPNQIKPRNWIQEQ